MDANPVQIKEFLRERLSTSMYDRLKVASEDFTLPLFRRDPETGAYECVLDDESTDDDELLIDAACTACELLAASRLEFVGDRSLTPDGDEKGEIRLEYRFDLDEEAVYDQFRRMLITPDQQSAGIRATTLKRLDGFLISVTMQYENDFDYQRKKDSLDWMLHLARKKANNSPFSGRKL